MVNPLHLAIGLKKKNGNLKKNMFFKYDNSKIISNLRKLGII